MLDGVTELPGGKDVVQLIIGEDPCVADDEVAFELVRTHCDVHNDDLAAVQTLS